MTTATTSTAAPIKQEPFNTCNSWGFGGGIGTVSTYASGAVMRKGTAYYRHAKSDSFCCYYNSDGKRLIDNGYVGSDGIHCGRSFAGEKLKMIVNFVITSNPTKAELFQFINDNKL